jgi:hypothetical protein
MSPRCSIALLVLRLADKGRVPTLSFNHRGSFDRVALRGLGPGESKCVPEHPRVNAALVPESEEEGVFIVRLETPADTIKTELAQQLTV